MRFGQMLNKFSFLLFCHKLFSFQHISYGFAKKIEFSVIFTNIGIPKIHFISLWLLVVTITTILKFVNSFENQTALCNWYILHTLSENRRKKSLKNIQPVCLTKLPNRHHKRRCQTPSRGNSAIFNES